MTVTEPELGAFIVTFVRAAALSSTAPVIGDPGTPVRARLVFVIAIAFGVGANRPGVPFVDVPLTAVIELASGIMTGACARFIVSRVAIAGQLMGLSLGLGFASQYDVHAGESAGTLRSLLMALAGLAFLSVGGLESIVRATAASPTHVGQLALLGPELVHQAGAAFGNGFALAGPIVLAALVANVGLAVMNRAAPAINMFSIALSAVLILGGVLLLATAANLVGGIFAIVRDAVAALGA